MHWRKLLEKMASLDHFQLNIIMTLNFTEDKPNYLVQDHTITLKYLAKVFRALSKRTQRDRNSLKLRTDFLLQRIEKLNQELANTNPKLTSQMKAF